MLLPGRIKPAGIQRGVWNFGPLASDLHGDEMNSKENKSQR
jgi:hypothetical protein